MTIKQQGGIFGRNPTFNDVTVDGGAIEVVRTSNPLLYLNLLTSDGDIAVFRKDGTTVGSIGTTAGNLWVAGATNGVRLAGGTFNATDASGTVATDTVSLGYSNGRWTDLYLSGGVYLGGTAAANYLDDYEEGTFVPAITFGGASTGVTYTARFGRYIKIGTLVYVNIAVNISNKGSSTGAAKVTGLPFTQSSVGVNFPNLNLRSVAGITFTNCLYATANDGATDIQLMDDNGSGTQTNLTNSDFTTGAELNITGVYEAA